MPGEGQLHQNVESHVLVVKGESMPEVNALFLTAKRSKFTYNSSAGQLSTEDLWDLPLSGKGG